MNRRALSGRPGFRPSPPLPTPVDAQVRKQQLTFSVLDIGSANGRQAHEETEREEEEG